VTGPGRYVVISFRGDDCHRWEAWSNLDRARACYCGVLLVDVDSVTPGIYDLEEGALLIDEDDFDEAYHGPKCASAERAMATLRAAYRQARE